MNDLRSGKEYWNEARKGLGYNRWLECIDEEGYAYRPTTIDDIEDLSMRLSGSLDWLGQRIAIETGQAREITPGIVKYKSSAYFETPFEQPAVLGEEHFTLSPNSDTPVWHRSEEFDRQEQAAALVRLYNSRVSPVTKGCSLSDRRPLTVPAALVAQRYAARQQETQGMER